MTFDYAQFIDDGFNAQEKYASRINEIGPTGLKVLETVNGELNEQDLAYRYAKVIEHFGHLIEEAIEARVYVPRRSWKNGERSYMDSPELRKEFIAEMYDILLFHRAILAYAGVTGPEFVQVAKEKQAYNQTRKDHNVNGDEAVNASPSEELAGNCASASFANNSYDRD
jgi:hypothetical protein